jgi:hypothetical protein
MIKFDFLSHYHTQYTEGDCWILARVLNEKYGSDIVISPSFPEWCHAAIMTRSGLVVDIEGIYNLDSFTDRHGFPVYWDRKENGKLESDFTFYDSGPHWDQANMIADMIVNHLNNIGVIL